MGARRGASLSAKTKRKDPGDHPVKLKLVVEMTCLHGVEELLKSAWRNSWRLKLLELASHLYKRSGCIKKGGAPENMGAR